MWIEILLVVLVLFFFLYKYVTGSFDRWDKEGIPNVSPRFPYGSYKEIVLQNRHLNEAARESYEEMGEHDFHGWYLFAKPVLSVNSLDHVKNVLVKDFDHFVDRNPKAMSGAFKEGGDMDVQVWGRQLLNLTGDEWKDVRSTFSPIFTSGKMKGMLHFIKVIGELLVNEFDKKAQSQEDFELKDVFGKFSLDSLACCAFGVDAESFSREDSKFVTYAARIFQNNLWDVIQIGLKVFPVTGFFMNLFKVNILKPKQTGFFKAIVAQTIAHRKKSGERKNDLIDLMLDCVKRQGVEEQETSSAESDWSQFEADMKLKERKRETKIDEDILVATAIVLLVAGYDTTGMTLSYMAYYLAKNPNVQDRLQREIDDAFEGSDGELPDYTVLQSLPYLEQTILETLRHQPPLGLLTRVCTKSYTFPGTSLSLKEDDMISIPVEGIHFDPRFYPDPHLFNPDNFSKEAKSQRNPYAFLPFGQGPRACIGMRFALLETKVAMAMVLRKFTFHDSPKNPEKLVVDPTSQLGYIKGGLWAKISPR